MNRTIRRSIRAAIIVLCVFLVYLGSNALLERIVRARAVSAIAGACGPDAQVSMQELSMDLLRGSLRATHLRMDLQRDSVFTPEDPRAFHASGTIDTVKVEGLHLFSLLFGSSLRMGELRISTPRITVFMRSDSVEQVVEMDGRKKKAVHIDRFELINASLTTYHTGLSGAQALVQRAGLHAKDLVVDPRSGVVDIHVASLTAGMDSIALRLSPLYNAVIGRIDLEQDGSGLRLLGVEIRPRYGPFEYQKAATYECDLIGARADTLEIQGLDIQAALAGDLSAAFMRVADMSWNIHRDKTMPDRPMRYMPLPQRALARLPLDVRLDSLRMERWVIDYHERGDPAGGYGDLRFDRVNALLTGLNSTDTLSDQEVRLTVSAVVYDVAPMDVTISTTNGSHDQRFKLDARIGAMPAITLNQMTFDLTRMKATAGRVHSVHYTLTADDHRAKGRVDMSYSGLKIMAVREDGRKNGLKTFVLNQVTRTQNTREDGELRHGDVEIERERDRSIFKYVWTGLREGSLAAILPSTVDEIRKIQQDIKGKDEG